ncbi:MAG: hypothetical protein A2V77_11000 [Anaeromyxobacter sp. RBG_16_69_14]|nr:MAG: hypothetical protein A2V77_11000 [Anaeromyxobacter sp. RBG_16_69_14]
MSCKALEATCTLPSECCSLACNGTCVEPSQCKAVGLVCGDSSDCCTNSCAANLCVEPADQCLAGGAQCSAASACCSGQCEGGSCTTPVVPACTPGGEECSANADCCSTACDATIGKCSSSQFCKAASEPCASGGECCNLTCDSGTGTCASGACLSIGESCSGAAQCCSGLCTNGQCAAVPTDSATCTTLGNACGAGSECCSTNCQGGKCVQAYSCNTTGDICYGTADCCSGLCSATVDGTPGRCQDAPGGHTQGGMPCANGSECSSRLCLDLGSGVKVCQPAGGCRMTDDYCDGTTACCGGTVDAIDPSGYGVVCNDDHVCWKGQSCNPPGNICGDIASQNCCGGKKDVCKADSNRILRCFGGPPAYCGSNGCDDNGPCPTGYDGANPQCCIEPGQVCQFSDQCCNGQTCAPDTGDGMKLKCGGGGAGTFACTSFGASCTGPADTNCCSGLNCKAYGETGNFYACLLTESSTTCKLTSGSCAGAGDCCSGTCTSGTCADFTNGSDTPSSCQGLDKTCTANGDCCAGTSCTISPGATSGKCQAAPVAVCGTTGQSCSATIPCCSATDTCTNSVCTPPGCGAADQVCDDSRPCCSGAYCVSGVCTIAAG